MSSKTVPVKTGIRVILDRFLSSKPQLNSKLCECFGAGCDFFFPVVGDK